MKIVSYLIFVFLLIGCTLKKRSIPIQHLDSREEASSFKDSLLNVGIDTVILYGDACSGCIPGSLEPYYLYWIEGGVHNLKRFTEEAVYYPIQTRNFPVDFIFERIEDIRSDSIVKPEFKLSHYNYDEVYIRIGVKEVNYVVDQFDKEENSMNFKVLLIDKIRSSLLEVPEWKWEGMNYKF